MVKRWLDRAGALIMDVPLHHTDTPPEKVGKQRAFRECNANEGERRTMRRHTTRRQDIGDNDVKEDRQEVVASGNIVSPPPAVADCASLAGFAPLLDGITRAFVFSSPLMSRCFLQCL